MVGGGHNGLPYAAYLAQVRPADARPRAAALVGGAAITEELRPGFSFTTFSYALSLLRPEIVHELNLVEHGFLPLMMPGDFHPTGDGGYLLFGDDEEQNVQMIRQHSRHDADAYTRYNFDLDRVIQTVRPLFDNPPPDIFGSDPEDQADVGWMLKHLGSVDLKTIHDTVRMLTGSAADLLDDYFEYEPLKGYLASSSSIGNRIGPMAGGSGLVLLYHKMGEHDGHLGSWSFHKGGNGGFTQVLARAAQSFGAEIQLEARVDHVLTRDGRAVGVVLADGTELTAPVVVSALDARHTFLDLVDPRELPDDLVDNVRRTRYRGTSAKVNFALDGMPEFPGLPGSAAPFGGFINIGPTLEYLERAYDAAKYGWYSDRPFIDGAMQSVIDPDMAPPGKHVLSCFVQHAPYEPRAEAPGGLGGRAGEFRRQDPGRARGALPGLRQAGAAARDRHAGSTSSGSPGSARATSSWASSWPRRCTSSGPRRAGASTPPRSTATTSAVRHPPRRLCDRLAGRFASQRILRDRARKG